MLDLMVKDTAHVHQKETAGQLKSIYRSKSKSESKCESNSKSKSKNIYIFIYLLRCNGLCERSENEETTCARCARQRKLFFWELFWDMVVSAALVQDWVACRKPGQTCPQPS